MHDMILELAQYEDGLDEVKASEEDLFRALFGGTSFSSEPANTPSGSPGIYAHVIDDPDGGLAAMAIWMLNYSTWEGQYGVYLEDLFVRQQYRGQGHGRALMEQLARTCVQHNYTRFQWWVLDWNAPALEFYRSLGAVPMDEWTVFRVSGPELEALAS